MVTISSLSKNFSTSMANKISLALRLKVVSLERICCFTSCWVKVEPPLPPKPVASDNNARTTAFGTTPL